MKLMVEFKLLVTFFCVHLAASAPLRLLRIRNMTFLFVESADGETVEILYAPGKNMGHFPVGKVPIDSALKNDAPPAPQKEDPAVEDNELPAREGFRPADDASDDKATSDDDDEPFDPELDAPRVEPSLIQAPKFKSPCDPGLRIDRQGNCRRIW